MSRSFGHRLMNVTVGKWLVIAGAATVVLGLLILFAPRIRWLGNLPGDIHLKGRDWSLTFPLTTCLALSAVVTLILWLASRLRR